MTTQHVFRKEGIPALAWPSSSSSSSSLCPCSLVIKVNTTYKQAAIVLHFELPIRGFDTDQRISLVYNADNWVPGAMKRGQEVIMPWHISQLARAQRGGDKMDSVAVVLKQPCTVLCPSLAGKVASRDGSNRPFQQLVALAKVTKISIVFDGAWLRPHKSALLSTLLEDSNLVNRFPRDHLQEAEAELDWTVFSPRESAPPEAPPAYRDASLKRSERSPTSSPQAPPPKRPLLDLGSPTERATTITTTPSPRLPLSSPVTDLRNNQDAVAKAVAEQLPDVVRAVLPDTLAHILGIPTSPLPSLATPSPSNATSAIQRFVLDHLTTHANELTQQVTSDTLEHVSELREQADDEFQDQLQDQRNNFDVLKEDSVLEMDIYYSNKMEEFKQETSELVEAQQGVLEEACLEAQEDMDEFIRRRRFRLKRELLRVELELLQPRVGRPTRSKSRRANSVPRQVGW